MRWQGVADAGAEGVMCEFIRDEARNTGSDGCVNEAFLEGDVASAYCRDDHMLVNEGLFQRRGCVVGSQMIYSKLEGDGRSLVGPSEVG